MRGADINNVLSDGSTAPHTASAVGDNEEVIRCCIEHGANVNATDWGGYAPIHVATVRNLATNVKCLIDCGADVCQRTYSGDDPIDLATQYDAGSVLDLFRNFDILAKYDIGRLMDMAESNGILPGESHIRKHAVRNVENIEKAMGFPMAKFFAVRLIIFR